MRTTRTRERRYTDEEVGQIIALAGRLDDAVSIDDPGLDTAAVVRVAQELGISEASVVLAIARHGAGRRAVRLGRAGKRVWRVLFAVHLFCYLSTVVFMGALDLVTGDGFQFTQYVVFGWGLVVVWHGATLWWIRNSGGGRLRV
jgi:hypothetical protein